MIIKGSRPAQGVLDRGYNLILVLTKTNNVAALIHYHEQDDPAAFGLHLTHQ